jgi:DNA-binding NtrC family response regulator
LETTHFDLVLADIRMSGINGIEGLELLTYIKERYDTDVIIMTGYDNEETEAEAYRRGACHYFSKPVDIPMLLETVAGKGIPTKYRSA